MSKLTTIQAIIAQAVIDTAERPPGRRGPYVFDEAKLQAAAKAGRAALANGDEG